MTAKALKNVKYLLACDCCGLVSERPRCRHCSRGPEVARYRAREACCQADRAAERAAVQAMAVGDHELSAAMYCLATHYYDAAQQAPKRQLLLPARVGWSSGYTQRLLPARVPEVLSWAAAPIERNEPAATVGPLRLPTRTETKRQVLPLAVVLERLDAVT